MIPGTRPAQHLSRVKPFEHRFGAATLQVIPDFNVDPGLWMPDQNADQGFTECVGYTGADHMVDIFHTLFLPDFSYAAARYITGEGPGTNGASFHAGMEGLVGVGACPAIDYERISTVFTAKGKGELYVSDWRNWPAQAKTDSLGYVQNGVRNVLTPGMDAFDAILLAAYQTKRGVSIGTPWMFSPPAQKAGNYQTWDARGVCETPDLSLNYFFFPWHNYAIKGKKTFGGVSYAAVKWWGGDKEGDHGWLYWNRETVNGLLAMPQTGALTIDMDANRWASVVGIAVARFNFALPFKANLIKAHA